MIRRLVLAVGAFALVLAACGDDGGGDDGASLGLDADAGADVNVPGAGINDIDDIDNAADAFLKDECEFVFDFSVALSASAGGDSKFLDDAIDAAPDELKADIAVLVDAYGEFFANPAAGAAALGTAEVEAASENLSAYLEANCEDQASIN